jgi:hypothetical protein
MTTPARRDEATREWLFKTDGQVFGPIPEPQLVELLFQGRIGAGTEVGLEDGSWAPISRVPGFLVHVRKAEAHARVEAEVTGARRLARRRGAMRLTAAATGAVVLVVVVAVAAWVLAVRRPWERRSRLLEDFGDGIGISAVRVGGGPRSLDEAVPDLRAPLAQGGAGARASRPRGSHGPRAAAANASAPIPGGGLVMAQYDVRSIQNVVAHRQNTLAPCLREEARRSPDFTGEIPIEFAVGNDGRVAQLWIDEPRFKSGELRECLERKLREWAFAPFPGQRPVVSLAIKMGAR